MARLATVQALCSLTHQVHELHHLDVTSVTHQVELVHATHFIVLRHDVLQLRASDVLSASPAMYTTSHTRMKLNGRLAGIISLHALGFAGT